MNSDAIWFLRHGKELYNGLSAEILDAAIEVHRIMGPGLLESVYQSCLVRELRSRHISCQEGVYVLLKYKGWDLDNYYVMDLLVEDEIIVELKAVEIVLPVHEAQVISYLRLANKKLGFLINFNEPLLKFGFRRFVNGF